MIEGFKSRRPWAAALISFFLGPFIGMLYLNRGRVALLYLLAETVVFLVIAYELPTIITHVVAVRWVVLLPVNIVGTVHSILIARRWDSDLRLGWFAHWYAVVFIFAVPYLIALPVRAFLYRPFDTPSTSMSPTLNVGDCFLVSRSAYRSHGPERGDLVVFNIPRLGEYYVKRAIGLPGDRVQMINDRLFINGKIVPQRRISDFGDLCRENERCHVPQYLETLPGGRSERILDLDPDGAFDTTPVFIVPPDSYFVLGDNRDNSDDSRADIGFIARRDIIGRVAIKYIENGHWVWKSPS